MSSPIYVLGIGLSHDGAACLLRDGRIVVAIEKERLTRIKHDGGNDTLAVQYCLDAAGITLGDLSLVVQCANFEKDEIRKDRYKGARLFPAGYPVPFVTISHHLAHAWSAIGTCPFDQCNVMVIDGCGSFYHQCDDLQGAHIPADVNSIPGLYGEKDSFYFFDGSRAIPLYKDFSIIRYDHQPGQVFLPTTRHSIGGLYSMAANYCFQDFDAAGKVMGLAPYGNRDAYTKNLFRLEEGRVFVEETVMHEYFTQPMDPVTRPFAEHFDHYAGIARWVQEEAERAILYLIEQRLQLHPHENLCYAGGVALNAVANGKLLHRNDVHLYIEPAAGDNGLALGCAYYGWMQVLGKEKPPPPGHTFFGRPYGADEVALAIDQFRNDHPGAGIVEWKGNDPEREAATLLAAGKTVGLFHDGAEFGPRALGRRSILADPRIPGIWPYINRKIKDREDFRPFAPAVLLEDSAKYFAHGWESPYMILVDQVKPEWKETIPAVVHVDGSCRIQTLRDRQEPFYRLLEAFRSITGLGVLLNTSLNRKAMPIIETPYQALCFLYESGLDAMVINGRIFIKEND